MNMHLSNESLNYRKTRLEVILRSHQFLLPLQEHSRSVVPVPLAQTVLQPALKMFQMESFLRQPIQCLSNTILTARKGFASI